MGHVPSTRSRTSTPGRVEPRQARRVRTANERLPQRSKSSVAENRQYRRRHPGWWAALQGPGIFANLTVTRGATKGLQSDRERSHGRRSPVCPTGKLRHPRNYRLITSHWRKYPYHGTLPAERGGLVNVSCDMVCPFRGKSAAWSGSKPRSIRAAHSRRRRPSDGLARFGCSSMASRSSRTRISISLHQRGRRLMGGVPWKWFPRFAAQSRR